MTISYSFIHNQFQKILYTYYLQHFTSKICRIQNLVYRANFRSVIFIGHLGQFFLIQIWAKCPIDTLFTILFHKFGTHKYYYEVPDLWYSFFIEPLEQILLFKFGPKVLIYTLFTLFILWSNSKSHISLCPPSLKIKIQTRLIYLISIVSIFIFLFFIILLIYYRV